MGPAVTAPPSAPPYDCVGASRRPEVNLVRRHRDGAAEALQPAPVLPHRCSRRRPQRHRPRRPRSAPGNPQAPSVIPPPDIPGGPCRGHQEQAHKARSEVLQSDDLTGSHPRLPRSPRRGIILMRRSHPKGSPLHPPSPPCRGGVRPPAGNATLTNPIGGTS